MRRGGGRVQSEYETPVEFFNTLDSEFHFTVDVCALPHNAKCKIFYTPVDDGLSRDWSAEICFCNPPYDRSISLWIKKAYESSQKGGTIVCLIQSKSTDTVMWHEYIMKSSEIRFVKDRLHFCINGKTGRANFASAVVIYRPYCKGIPKICSIDRYGEKI